MSQSRLLSILHTNDFHNKLTAAQAGSIRARRESLGANTLLLDAGDAVSAGNVGVRLGGEPILELMNKAGYDAMTAGNREFHIANAIFRHKVAMAKFPILCANIVRQNGSLEALPVQPSIVKALPNGLKVGVIGVTVPMVTRRMAARVISAFVFDDPLEVVQELARQLRPHVDVVIALTHIGIREDERLAASCGDLDLIIGGHSHVTLDSADMRFGVPIVQAGWFAHSIGETTLCQADNSVSVTGSVIHDLNSPAAAS